MPQPVIGAQVADRLLSVPQAGDDLRAPYLFPFPGKQHRVIQAPYTLLAGEQSLRGRIGQHRQARFPFVDGLAGFVGPERTADLIRLFRPKPEPEAIEAQPAAAELDGPAAERIEVGSGRQLEADIVQRGKLTAEVALRVTAL